MMKNSKKLLIFTVILLIINIVVYKTRLGGDVVLLYFSDGLPIVCSLISCLCLYSAYREFKQFDYTKIVWLLILIGISLDFVAETLYAVLEIGFKVDMNSTFPTIADLFWCTAYIPIFIGLMMMYIGFKRSGFSIGKNNVPIILSVVIFLIWVIVISFILIPIVKDNEISLLTKFFYLFYPVADILELIPVIILIYITSFFVKGVISKPWKYMALGFMSFAVADLLYSYLSWQNLYGSGNIIDLAWHFGYLATGLAGLYQKELIKSLNEITV